MLKKSYIPLIVLSVLWWGLIFLVGPWGNFPLNDDWAYAKNVYELSENGRLFFHDWPAMTLLTQMVWGAFFCKIFGFSFEVLRFSTFVASWIAILLFFRLTQKLSEKMTPALGATLIFLFNPLFFVLSFSFMTEPLFLALTFGALHGYARYMEQEQTKDLAWATGFAILAILIRQTGLILPLAFALAWPLAGSRSRASYAYVWLGFAACYAALSGFTVWLAAHQGLPSHFSTIGHLLARFEESQKEWFTHTMILFFYLGFFLLPGSLFLAPTAWNTLHRPWMKVVAFLVAGLMAYGVYIRWDAMPFGNVIFNWGLGPIALKDVAHEINPALRLSYDGFIMFKTAGTLGAFLIGWLLVATIFARTPSRTLRHMSRFAAVAMAGYGAYLLLDLFFFDRYYLYLVPLLIVMLLPVAAQYKPDRLVVLPAAILAGFLVFFSVAGTHDYLSWNRARWSLLNEGLQQGIPPTEIDGGFEFNGMYETGPQKQNLRYQPSWWFVKNDTYAVSFGPLDCYDKVKSIAYPRWLNFDHAEVWWSKAFPLPDTVRVSCDAEQLTTKDSSMYVTSNSNIGIGNGQGRREGVARSGTHAALLNEQLEYAFGTRIDDVQMCDQIIVKVWYKGKAAQVSLVIAAPESPDYQLYLAFQPQPGLDNTQWQCLEARVALPPGYPHSSISTYLWNNGGPAAYFDDFSVTHLRRKR